MIELILSGYAVLNDENEVIATYPPGESNERKANWFCKAIMQGTPYKPQVVELFRKAP